MSFGSLFDIVNEFRSPKPTLFTFDFPIGRRPTNLTAKDFKVALTLLPFFLLYGISEFTTREFQPQSFNGRQVGSGNILHIGKVDKISLLLTSTRNINQSISSELICFRQLSSRQHGRQGNVIHTTLRRKIGRNFDICCIRRFTGSGRDATVGHGSGKESSRRRGRQSISSVRNHKGRGRRHCHTQNGCERQNDLHDAYIEYRIE
mmetsp:Transcript_26435/g.76208  ORF Transcript_26435/g.76208 Transcript_26435/m.76208 type:complete len:205 (-) Transcript_26435:25-639(-)